MIVQTVTYGPVTVGTVVLAYADEPAAKAAWERAYDDLDASAEVSIMRIKDPATGRHAVAFVGSPAHVTAAVSHDWGGTPTTLTDLQTRALTDRYVHNGLAAVRAGKRRVHVVGRYGNVGGMNLSRGGHMTPRQRRNG